MNTVERCPTCGSIKCPSCGAPLKEGVSSCPYCFVEIRISEDGKEFLKVERLVCPHCGAKISRSDPFCPSCKRKAWQYCPNLECTEKFDLNAKNCPLCGTDVKEGIKRLQSSWENLRENAGSKAEEIESQLDPEEHILILLNAVEDTLILTDSRLVHRAGRNYFTYLYSEIEDASLDKFGNLIISLGGEKPHEILIICPTKKEGLFSQAVKFLLKLRDRSRA